MYAAVQLYKVSLQVFPFQMTRPLCAFLRRAKLEYKFIIKQGAALHWQQGANKGVTVPNAAAVEVLDSWSQAQTNFKIVDDSPAAITAQQEGTEGQETYLESQESTSEELASQQEQLEAQEQDTASRIEKAQQVARSYDYEHPEILHKAVETLENIGADTEVRTCWP